MPSALIAFLPELFKILNVLAAAIQQVSIGNHAPAQEHVNNAQGMIAELETKVNAAQPEGKGN